MRKQITKLYKKMRQFFHAALVLSGVKLMESHLSALEIDDNIKSVRYARKTQSSVHSSIKTVSKRN
ncbi:hypothetical protein ER45_028590 (plasmid) [Bacillus mycoides]|nr:hypothetical protein ER45_028590 [Bacillus mycoides]